jgi:spore coat-associated protein N
MIKSLFASTAKGIGSIGLKVVIVSAATIGGAALVSSSVFASLTATATNPAQSVQTGTLKLTQVSSTSPASGGITTTISGMAPGDTVNRYIDAASMTLGLADSASTALTTNGTAGLQVVVNACTLAWSAAGVCTGTTTAMMSTKTALLMTGTPQTLALPAGATTAASITHLQISLSLPAGSEVTINGVLPTGTVQGLTSSLVWTFTETERTTTTTNS